MAKRDPQPAGPARGRGKPVQIQPKTPWGFILGAGLLGLLLIGIVAYAVVNQGEGFEDPLERADGQFDALNVSNAEALSRNHVEGPVRYPQTPPTGGDHNGVWQNCQVYDQQIAPERAVHSLEHGAVWITHRPDLPAAQLAQLREVAEGEAYVLVSPLPEQTAPVVLTAWGRQLTVEQASDDRVQEFVDVYADGPQSQEPGATCSGGTSAQGPLPAAPPAPAATAPAPAASGPASAPAPSPSR
jgi:hypothetical protein